MGYMRHHAILVTTYDDKRADAAHQRATEICGAVHPGLVTPILESPINGYCTFAIFPDGSKEGWAESDAGDGRRAEFVGWLESHRYSDGSSPFAWVEIQYGDDEHETLVVRHSDEPPHG